MAKKKLTEAEKIAKLSPIQQKGRLGLNLDEITKDIPRKKDGTYTPQNQKRRHDAVAAWFLAKSDEDKLKAVEAALPPARQCSFCGEEKRNFRLLMFKGERYILCKECEDGALITGEPLGKPKYKPTPEMLDDGESVDNIGMEDEK